MNSKLFIFQDLRREYQQKGLDRDALLSDPFEQFEGWFQEAVQSGVIEPNAFSLATATRDGKPSSRIVLMKYWDRDGLLFFTNYGSRKCSELEANPYAAATFWWGNIERQVRIEGFVEKTERSISEEYFRQRPRTSQLGAWASRQGKSLHSKEELLENYRTLEEQFKTGDVPCPTFWGGYRIVPQTFEFWQGCGARLHDRFLYVKEGSTWSITRLSP